VSAPASKPTPSKPCAPWSARVNSGDVVPRTPDRAGLKRFEALLAGRVRAPQLAKLAEFIRTEMGLRVTLEPSYVSTDRKPKGLRYITRQGKGRRGTRLQVFATDDTCMYSHNSAEGFRTNSDVVRWIRLRLEGYST
jgi:hypothetical protein